MFVHYIITKYKIHVSQQDIPAPTKVHINSPPSNNPSSHIQKDANF